MLLQLIVSMPPTTSGARWPRLKLQGGNHGEAKLDALRYAIGTATLANRASSWPRCRSYSPASPQTPLAQIPDDLPEEQFCVQFEELAIMK